MGVGRTQSHKIMGTFSPDDLAEVIVTMEGYDHNDVSSLAHTRWNCKYHIVFAPKYRRKVFFGEKRVEIGKILRKLCE